MDIPRLVPESQSRKPASLEITGDTVVLLHSAIMELTTRMWFPDQYETIRDANTQYLKEQGRERVLLIASQLMTLALQLGISGEPVKPTE